MNQQGLIINTIQVSDDDNRNIIFHYFLIRLLLS